jgi:aspartate aminotransferase-like enzyme
MGVECFAKAPSPSVTALKMPPGIDGQKIRADMEKSELVVVMGGQDQLKGKVIRIGHMGAIRDEDLVQTLEALAVSLNRAHPGLVSTEQVLKARTKALDILKQTPAVVMT